MIALALAFVVAAAGAAPADFSEARQAQSHGAELFRQGDLRGALSEFDRAVRLDPGSALAWYNRGLVRRDLKDCRSAIEDFSHAVELDPAYFSALYQRGNCRQAIGDFEHAIEDYGRAADIPGRNYSRFLAYFARADAERRLGRLGEARTDYTHVMELRDDTRALRSRAWVSFYLGRWHDAYQDLAKYVHDTQAKEPDAAYAVILAVLALRRAGQADQASRFLAEWRPQLDAAKWPAPVLAYLADGNENSLIAQAKRAGERTEAGAYLGADLLARGQQARGIEKLQDVLRRGEPGYFEYDLAYYELARLGLAHPGDRRRRKP